MKKKRYEGTINSMAGFEIYLNINHLERGEYKLKIIDKNKLIKQTSFIKR